MSDELESQLAALYRDQASEEPPAYLDVHILTAARRRSWWRRNGWKAASATCLVLVIASATLLNTTKTVEKSTTALQTHARTYLLGNGDSGRTRRALLSLRPQQSALTANLPQSSQKEFLR